MERTSRVPSKYSRCIRACLLLLWMPLGLMSPRTAQAQLTLDLDMVLDSNALVMGNTGNFRQSINGQTHQAEPLVSFGGYQFATWYQNGANDEQDVILARRDLSDPSNTWQVLDTGYDMLNGDEDGNGSGSGRWDSHNVIAMGISGDGRIHLAYDHHVDDLRYLTTSGTGKATLSNSDWATQTADAANLFFVPGGERDKFNTQDNNSVTRITYPRFADGPNGDIVVTYRIGGSGNGDIHFLSYNADTSAAGGTVANGNGVLNQRWSDSHIIIDGNAGTYSDAYDTSNSNSRNAYLNGMDSDDSGRLHLSWTWRESSQGANHDIMYAYSDDGGTTWQNNNGVVIANKNTGQMISLNSPGIIIANLDRTQSVMNQQGQTVAPDGTVHILMWHRRDDGVNGQYDWQPGERFSSSDSAYYHYHRDPATGSWTRNQLPTSRSVGTRPKIGHDAAGNVYAVYTSGGRLVVAGATKDAGYTDWQLLYEGTRRYEGDALLDQSRLLNDSVLSIFIQDDGQNVAQATGTALRVLEFNLPSVPDVCNEPSVETTDVASYVDRHVIQGNFQSGANDLFLEGNSNGRRVGAGGASGNNRVNNPILQFALPTLTNSNITAANFSISFETPAVTSGADFDIVATLLNTSDLTSITASDFNDDSTNLGNGSLIDTQLAANVADGGTLNFNFGSDGLALLQSFYSGVTPTQADVFVRLSAATPHEYPANISDRYNLLTSDGSTSGALVSTFTVTTTSGGALKGDVDLDGAVTFADIAPFIAVLQAGAFQAEADIDCNMQVDFADIPAFIAILQGQ